MEDRNLGQISPLCLVGHCVIGLLRRLELTEEANDGLPLVFGTRNGEVAYFWLHENVAGISYERGTVTALLAEEKQRVTIQVYDERAIYEEMFELTAGPSGQERSILNLGIDKDLRVSGRVAWCEQEAHSHSNLEESVCGQKARDEDTAPMLGNYVSLSFSTALTDRGCYELEWSTTEALEDLPRAHRHLLGLLGAESAIPAQVRAATGFILPEDGEEFPLRRCAAHPLERAGLLSQITAEGFRLLEYANLVRKARGDLQRLSLLLSADGATHLQPLKVNI